MDKLQLQVLLAAVDRATAPLKRINGASNATSRALKEARDRLKDLNAQQSNLQGYAKQREAVRGTSEELAKAQEKLRQYREQLKGMDAPSAKFQKTFANASAEVDRLTRKHGDQRRELQRLIPLVKNAGVDTRNLGASEQRLVADITAANAAIKQQKDRLAALGVQQERVAKAKAAYSKGREFAGNTAMVGASAAATGAAMGAPIIGMVKAYSSFEDAMAGVAKQVAGARDANGQLTPTYYAMADGVKKLSETIPMATTDIAALVEGGARMGVEGKENLLEFARVAANASTAFELPADQISENLARIADLYKLPISNIGQLGDAINYLDDNAKSKGADIIDVMQRTAGITATVGMSFKDAAALGSTFLSLGATAEVAGTATNAMIRELNIATQQPKRFQKGLKALGLEAEAIQTGMATNSTATIQMVLEAINKLPKKNQLGVTTQIFGKEYSGQAAKLANNLGEYRRQLELVNDAKGNGSMDREAAIAAEKLSGRWIMSKSRLFNLSAALGETLRPQLVQILDAFNGLISKVDAWVKVHPAMVSMILKTTAGIAALAAGFGAVALTLSGLMGPFLAVRLGLSLLGIKLPGVLGLLWKLGKVVIPFVFQALLWLGKAAMANPIGIAITLLAAAAYLLYANWDKVKTYFAGLWVEIQQGVSGGLGGILALLVNFSPLGLVYRTFAGVMSYLGIELPGRFTEFGGMILQGLANGITNALGAVKQAITGAGEATIGWFKDKLGIHSPSRVFAELGGFTMAGLTQGLQAGANGPLAAVAGTAKRLAQAGTLAAGLTTAGGAVAIDNRAPLGVSAPPAGQAAGNSYTIQVYAAPGMDEQALARLVGAEIDKRERAKQTRGRSSLYDKD
ncbi:phage tail tape measure protein [Pseudomonas kuykendallii]|uniref:Phage tail tape measure protein, TP901 family, core region n=1 Tax=Pseudomonas kuykendallii TaxID=1007099 RepID=A0A1H3DJZ7_9PSED|nr:phage tail tape measure protein [Pseudomonas kuykendallii]MCQ4270249.1 phage tail tape measure protein [Pseudomonas kuykendallii]SDX66823.1 phage tail tape measure protein, TP901 family, core region [Pseudomonas kuykendallii]